jgi:RHS repeat-associated protein
LNAVPGGWAFDGLAAHDEARGIVRRYVRAATTSDPASFDAASLYAGGNLIAETQTSSFGEAAARSWFHAGVVRQLADGVDVANGLVVDSQTENGSFTQTRRLDESGRLVSETDEAGGTLGFVRDVLGRVRAVQLQDGHLAHVVYDGHARARRIDRDGIGAVELSYDPVSGILTGERITDGSGGLVRTVAYTVDAIGRRTQQRDVADNGDCQTLHLYHDGATPARPTQVSMLGFLSGVSGDGWSKTLVHRADGKLLERLVLLGSWRSVDTTFTWGEDGTPTGHTTALYGPNGLLQQREERSHFDAFGRLASVDSDGKPMLSIGYDADDRVSSLTLTDGSTVSFSYDSYTELVTGFAVAGNGFASVDGFRRNARGLLDTETLGVGSASVTRTYGYSPQRFLTSSSDTQVSYGYGYDGSGLINSISDADGERSITRSAGALDTGGVAYAFDASGRTIQRGDLTLHYGANGHLASATRGNDCFGFVYDENGNRILKTKNGTPVAAYVEEGYLDENGLIEPLLAGGRLIGVVQSGAAQLLPVDHRGTLLGNPDGTTELPSPYGDRATHPQLAAALDYVRKGYDADLGTVRMGLRDYDPRLGQFLTPDPYLFLHPDACAGHPAECNLYSYAANDPLSFHDPEGRIANWIIGGVGGFVGGFVVGFAYEGGRAIFGHHEFHLKDAAKRGLSWGITAGTIGVTGGASLYWQATAAVSGGIAGGYAYRKMTGKETTGGDVALDGALGLAGWGVGKFVLGPAAKLAYSRLNTLVRTSFQAWRNVNPNILSGHGAVYIEGGANAARMPVTVVPPGTSVTVWTEHGATITDALGNAVETGQPPTGFTGVGGPAGGNTPGIVGARTYLPGAMMPDYTLHPPAGLNIMGNPTTAFWPARLSSFLKANMGNVNWAACLEVLIKK